MDEVDYSKFLYKPDSPLKPPKPENKSQKKERKPRSRGKKAVTVVIVVILCFSILFVCVDFFAKGKITRSIYSLMIKHEYSYYLVTSSYPTRDMAHAGALLAENGGGAGYLFSENGDFFVAFQVSVSKTDAQKIVDRNANYFLYTLSYSTSQTNFANLIDGFVRDVGIALDGMDAGTFTESGLQTVFTNYSVLFSAFEPESDEETSLQTFILSCLNSLGPGVTERTALLFQTRHMLCSVLFSARETFG